MIKFKASFAGLLKERHAVSDRRRLLGTSPRPIKMAYTSYELAAADGGLRPPPLIIMHGLFGNKSNWNGLSKALHSMTRRKVRARLFTVTGINSGQCRDRYG